MKEFHVSLTSFNDVKNLVAITSSQPFSIHAIAEHMITNAKSLLGFFSLDLQKPVTVRVEDEVDTTAFARAIASFLI